MPIISVILPTYNRANFIRNSIDSVLNQTFEDIELIIVDDGSSDDTPNIINTYKDSRIKYIRFPNNKGVSHARNAGIKASAGQYIAFQDSDDTWDLTKLEKQYDYLMSNPNYNVVYTKMRCNCSELSIPDFYTPNDTITENELSGFIYKPLLIRNYIGAPTLLIEKSIITESNLFDESMKSLEDWDFILRIAAKHPIGYIDEPLHIYNLHNNDHVSLHVEHHFESLCKIISRNKKSLIEYNILNDVMSNLLTKAQEYNVLEPVGKMLECYLQID